MSRLSLPPCTERPHASNVRVQADRKVKGMLDELKLSAASMPRHWPSILKAAYPHIADDDGHMKKYIPKKKS